MIAIFGRLLKKLLVQVLGKMCIGVDQQQLQLHLESGRLQLKNVVMKTDSMTQPNSLLQIKSASIGRLEIVINWKHLLTQKLIVRLENVEVQGQLVNRLRSKSEIINDKLKLLQNQVKNMIETRIEGSLSKYLKKKIMAIVINNLHIEIQKITLVIKEDKVFNYHISLDRFDLWSVPTQNEQTKIHKLMAMEISTYSLSDTKARRDLMNMAVTGQGVFKDRQNLDEAQVSLVVSRLKINIDIGQLPRLLRKLDPLSKPNQMEPDIRPLRSQDKWLTELFRYHVRSAVGKIRKDYFLNLLHSKGYNIRQFQKNKRFISIVYRMPLEVLQSWLEQDQRLKDIASTVGHRESQPLFSLQRIKIRVANIEIYLQLSRDSLSGRIEDCQISMQSFSNPKITTISMNLASLQFIFNQITLIRRHCQRDIMSVCVKQVNSHTFIKLFLTSLEINMNHDVVMRILKTYYRLFPKQVTRRSSKFVVKAQEEKAPPKVEVIIENIGVNLEVTAQRRQILNKLWLIEMHVDLINHIIKTNINVDHQFIINGKTIKVLDGVSVSLELIRGDETIVILRQSDIRCNFGQVFRFKDILSHMQLILNNFTSLFKTRTFQVHNCQKIGAAYADASKTVYYTIDGSKFYLFSSSSTNNRLREYPQKIQKFTDIDMFQPLGRQIKFKDGTQLTLPNNKEFKNLLFMYEEFQSSQVESKPLTILIQKTSIDVQFQLSFPYAVNIKIEYIKAMLHKVMKVMLKIDLELRCRNDLTCNLKTLSVSFLPTLLNVSIGKLYFKYGEFLLDQLKEIQVRILSGLSKNDMKEIKQESKPPMQIGLVMKQADIDLAVSNHYAFVRIFLNNFVVRLEDGLMFQGKLEVSDLTSYPYTRFMSEPRIIFQAELSFNNMKIHIRNMKAMFIMEVVMRILNFSLEQVDRILAFLPSDPKPKDQPEKDLDFRLTINSMECLLFPTCITAYSNNMTVTYRKINRRRIVDGVQTIVSSQKATVEGLIGMRANFEQMLQNLPLRLQYDLVQKRMVIPFSRLVFNLTNRSFNLLIKFIFNNIIYSDGFVLEPKKVAKPPDPNARLMININFDEVALNLLTNKMKFILSMDNLMVEYGKVGPQAHVFVAFYKLRVKDVYKDSNRPVINGFEMFKVKEDTFKSNKDRKVLKMTMNQGMKSELDIGFEDIQLTGNKDKLIELLGFFNMEKETFGMRVNKDGPGMLIHVEFPRINIYLETTNMQFYVFSLNCFIDMDTNFKKPKEANLSLSNSTNESTTNSTTSVLKIHLNDLNLRQYAEKASARRNIMNRPNIRIIMESVQQLKDVNPKSLKTINVHLENCRITLTVKDILSILSILEHQKDVAKELQLEQIIEEAMEEENEQEKLDSVQAIQDSVSMMVFQIEIEEVDIIISNSQTEMLVPLIQMNIKSQQFSGTINQSVNVLTIKMLISIGYFNLSATRIEPILQPMQLIIELCRNTVSNPNNFISVVMPKVLVNISDEMLQTYKIVSRDMRKIDTSYGGFAEKQLKALVLQHIVDERDLELGDDMEVKNTVTLFSFKNDTGFVLSVFEKVEIDTQRNSERQQQRLFCHLKRQQLAFYRVAQNEYDFGKTYDRSTKFSVSFKDGDKQYGIRCIKINNMLRNETSSKYYIRELGSDVINPEMYFIAVMDITHYKKEFLLKSRLYFKNKLMSPVNLRLFNNDTNYEFSLSVDEEIAIPFTLFLKPQIKFQIKHPSKPAFSEGKLLRDYMLSDKEIEQFIHYKIKKVENFDMMSPIVMESKETKMSIMTVNLIVNPHSRVQTITITPMIRIFNCMPLDLTLDTLELTIPANSQAFLNQCGVVQKTMMTVREFKTKKQVLLYDAKYNEMDYDQVITLVNDVAPRQKTVNINIKRKKKKGILQIIVSARIVIINETGLPLLVYLNGCKSSEKVILANETDKMKFTSLHNNDYSKELDLKLLPHSSEIEYIEKNGEESTGQLFELNLNTTLRESTLTNEIVITKVIEITPKYIIYNRTQYELEVTQPDSFNDPIKYKAFSRGVLFWPNPQLEKRIVVRIFEKDDRSPSLSKWKWSGAFTVLNIRIVNFYIRKKAKTKSMREMILFNKSANLEGDRVFFKAQVKRFSSFTCILIEEVKKQAVEYLIVNETKYIVLLEQANNRELVNKDYFAVKPYSRLPFSWIEPDLKKKIKISVLEGQRVVQSSLQLTFDSSVEQQSCLFQGLSIRFKVRKIIADRKIIQITTEDKSVAPMKKMFKTAKRKANYLAILLKEFGLNIIAIPENKKIQLFFIKMDFVSATIEQSATFKFDMAIKNFTIDNNTRNQAVFPVLLTSTINLPALPSTNFLEMEFEKERDSPSPIKKVIMLRVSLVPLSIRTDESLAKVLLLTYRKLFKKKQESIESLSIDTFRTIDYVFTDAAHRNSIVDILEDDVDPYVEWKIKKIEFSTNFIHIERLSLPSIEVQLTFNHLYSIENGDSQVFGQLYASFGLAIPNLEKAPIRVGGIELEEKGDTTVEALLGEIIRQYKDQIIQNVLSIIGSVNILGGPARIMKILKRGIADMVDKPRRVWGLGPAAVTLTVLQGISGLLKASVMATLHFLHSIGKAVTNGILVLSFDQRYLDQRRELNRFEPEDVLSGLQSSFRSITFAMQSALEGSNIFSSKYANDGFGMATLKALTGLVVKPVTGLMDGANHILKGSENMMTSELDRPNQNRRRRLRVFYQKIRYFKEYSEADAKIMEFLSNQKEFKDLQLIECIQIKMVNTTNYLVLTISWIIMIEEARISWKISPKQVQTISYSPFDRVNPLIKDRAKIILYFDNKIRAYSINVNQDDLQNRELYKWLKRIIEDLKNI